MKLSLFAPALGALGYVVGDILLLAAEPDKKRFSILRRPDVEETVGAMLPFSQKRLFIGAATGPIATPLLVIGACQRLRQLNLKADSSRLLPGVVGTSYCASAVLSAVIHGSFYYYARLFQQAQTAADIPANEAGTEQAVLRALKFGKKLEKLYYPLFMLLISGSIAEAKLVIQGRSPYPRWSAPLITPVIPMVLATAVTANGTGRHPAWRSLQGAGLSLGELVAFVSAALLVNSD